MKRFARIAVLATITAGLVVPMAAQAENSCTSDTVIFSRHSEALPSGQRVNGPNANPNALICIADIFLGTGEDADFRYLGVGANQISIRYIQDLGVASLTAVLDGMGFSGTEVTLVPVTTATGSVTYDSCQNEACGTTFFDIPTPTSGSITATVFVTEEDGTRTEIDHVTFRTIDQ